MLSAIRYDWFRALRSWRPESLVLTFTVLAAVAGAFAAVQEKLTDLSFSIVKRPASGEIVIVQIDGRSLAALDTWPWPRERHAALIEKLAGAGAELVAFDVAFTSPTTIESDARLGEAIRKFAGRIILPSFAQHDAPGLSASVSETYPLPLFREGALIGNANVFAPTGAARTGSVGLYLPDGAYRPTFSGLIGQQGSASITDYAIDFGIDLKSFPRISYSDALHSDFDTAAVKGKRVIVGATAVELGDRVPVPMYGVIAGVELQAMMADSLMQGRALANTGLSGAVLIVLLVLLILRPGRARWSAIKFGAPAAACAFVLATGPPAVLAVTPVLVEAAAGFAALAACVVYVGARELSVRASALLRERAASNLRRAMITLIVEESSDGVIVSNLDGRIELINERAAKLLSATRSTILGRELPDSVPRFHQVALGPGVPKDATLRQTEIELECAGEVFTLDLNVRRLTLPGVEAGQEAQIDVYTLHDLTLRRRTEEAERRAQQEKLMAERAKSNFIANMSHELRTPLNAIIGFSEIIAKETMGPVGSPEYAEYADVVAKSGHHLLTLINNVLEISRIDQNATDLAIETLDFSEVVQHCIGFVRDLRDYKDQEITVTADGAAFASDLRLIKSVVINLLSNAVKFSSAGSVVNVDARTEGDDFVIAIADHGVGISSELMPHLTELFYQTDASFTRRFDGMGVGLYLVKRHVELLNGSLGIESEQGKGTRVTVRLAGAARRHGAPAIAAA